MGSFFVHPGLLLGSLLFLVPLIIHLLYRRRYRTVPWAAMQFLLRAHERRHRKLRYQNVLLLILRCLVPILAAIGLARPFLHGGGALGGILPERRVAAVILDNSSSMSAQAAAESPFERARELIRVLLDSLDARRGDRVSLFTTAPPLEAGGGKLALPAMTAGPQLLSKNSASFSQVLAQLLAMDQPSFRVTNHADALELALSHLGELAIQGEVLLFTDMQRTGWIDEVREGDAGGGDAKPAGSTTPGGGATLAGSTASGGDTTPGGGRTLARIRAAIRGLNESGWSLHVIDVGSAGASPRNVAIDDLSLNERTAITASPTSAGASMRNLGAPPNREALAVPYLDGTKHPAVPFSLAAGGLSAATIPLLFPHGGNVALSVAIDPDGYARDDRRYLAIHVKDHIRVLVVDGDPRADAFQSETDYLRLALDPFGEGEGREGGRFEVHLADDKEYLARPDLLRETDLVILANVASLTEKAAADLERFVRDGGGCMIFAGDRVDTASWNQRLWREGAGMLPGRLGARAGFASHEDEYLRIVRPNLHHPILQLFSDPRYLPLLVEVPVWEYLEVDVGQEAEDVEVLARLDAEREPPLLLEKRFGQGRVVLIASTADRDWWALPDSPKTFLPLVQDAVSHLAGEDSSRRNLLVGQPWTGRYASFPEDVAVVHPSGERVPLEVSAAADDAEGFRLEPFTRTDTPGFYRVQATVAEGGVARPVETLFAVNVDPRESDLRRIEEPELRSYLGDEPWAYHTGIEGFLESDKSTHEGELWRYVVAGVVGLLVLESLLAWRFGRTR